MLRPTVPLGHLTGIRIGAHWSALVAVVVFTVLPASVLSDGSRSAPALWSAALGRAAPPTDRRAGPAPSRNPSGGHDVRTAGR